MQAKRGRARANPELTCDLVVAVAFDEFEDNDGTIVVGQLRERVRDGEPVGWRGVGVLGRGRRRRSLLGTPTVHSCGAKSHERNANGDGSQPVREASLLHVVSQRLRQPNEDVLHDVIGIVGESVSRRAV